MNSTKNIASGLCLLSLFFASKVMAQACHNTEAWLAMQQKTIALYVDDKVLPVKVRMADEAKERAAGYQWICEADAAGSAVLFVFPQPFLSAFHMRKVFVPLDIYYFDAGGQVVDHLEMAAEPPNAGRKPQLYRAKSEFSYALEMPRNHPYFDQFESLHLSIESLR